ncbi:MAG: hypothetical protein HMLKMBBP_02489 [Planctomycetes bacterium]|nr:hypothetical protein [Planctomycetota bacterium]
MADVEAGPAEEPRPSRAKRILFQCAATLAVLGGLEVGARLFVPPPEGTLLASPLDGMPNLALTDYFEGDAELFWRLRPNLNVRPGYWGDRTNSAGLRMASDVPDRPDPKRRRVLCVGDSCTYGLGVALVDAWPTQLAERSGLDVLNAGVPGYSSHQGAILAARLQQRFRPDVTIVQFGNNDAAPWPSRDGDAVAAIEDHERSGVMWRSAVAQRSRLAAMVFGWTSPRRAPPGVLTPERIAELRPRVPADRYAENLRRICAGSPRAIVVVWPRQSQIDAGYDDVLPAARVAELQARAAELANADTVDVIDVGAVFRESGFTARDLFVEGCHATPLGNALVAAALTARLVDGS